MKKIIIAILLIQTNLIKAQNNAQAFDWSSNPGSASNALLSIKQNSQGETMALYRIRDSAKFFNNVILSLPLSGYPTDNYFIGKKNNNGTGEVVIERGNTTSNVYSTYSDFVLDNNDNIVLGGRTSAGNDFGNGVTLSGKGYFLAKYNSQGIAQWAKMYNFNNPSISSFSTEPWLIQCLANGEILAIRNEGNRFNLIRLDANGNELLDSIINIQSGGVNTLKSSLNNCIADANGNFYLYLNSTSNQLIVNNDTTTITNGSHPATAFIYAYNKFGTKIYSKGWRGSIKDIAVDTQTSNLYISWTQYGGQLNTAPMNNLQGNAGTFIESFSGIVCVDSNANFIKKSTENQSDEYPYQSILPINGGRILGTFEHNTGVTITAGTQNYSVANGSAFTWIELDENLNRDYFISEPAYNASNSKPVAFMACKNNKVSVGLEWSRSVQIDLNINGNILSANKESLTFPTRYSSPFNLFGKDATLAEYSREFLGTVGLKTPSVELNLDYNLFPNPATNQITISLNDKYKNEKYRVRITNIVGEEIYKSQERNFPITLSTSNLKSGIYFVTLNQNETTITKKLIIE